MDNKPKLPVTEGSEAYQARQLPDANPYPEADWRHDEWYLGWSTDEQCDGESYDFATGKFFIKVLDSDLDGTSEKLLYKDSEPFGIIRWFAINRPYPEKDTGQVGGSIIKIVLANQQVLQGEEISHWIHSMACPVCKLK